MAWPQIKNFLIGENNIPNTGRKLRACALISTAVMLLLNVIRIYDYFINPNNTGLSLYITLGLLLFFASIWLLARRGKYTLSGWLLISAYAVPTILCFYLWGADLPAGILMAVLVIVLAGMFLGSLPALIVTITINAAMITLTYLQHNNIWPASSNWRLQPHEPADALAYTFLFGIIFFLAWIIFRENHRALRAAAVAQQKLQEERDQLEITVAERTKAITQIQREKLEQLQVLAGIGQVSGGIFHDIINPLTAVSLNLEQLETEYYPQLNGSQEYLQQALAATGRIKDIIGCANSCLRRQNPEILFSIRGEISKIRKIMNAKARAQGVDIYLDAGTDIKIKGGPTRFGQVIMNLVANAIDACAQPLGNKNKKIKIWTEHLPLDKTARIVIEDNGSGINPDNISKIFNSFFTTKNENKRNLGLGLSMVKKIIETDFNGRIEVNSILGKGTAFTLFLPTKL